MRQNQSQRNDRMDRYEGSSYRNPGDMSSSRRSEWEFDRPDRVEASRMDRSNRDDWRPSQDDDRSQGYRADRSERTDRSSRSERDFGSRSYTSPREERSNFGAGSSYSGTTGTTYGSYGRDEYGSSSSNANYGSSRGASFDRNDRGYQGYDRNESDLEGRGYEASNRLGGTFSSTTGMRNERSDRSDRSDLSSRSEGRTSYAGRGPKGYKRSDDRIKEDVSEMLSRDHAIDASDIEVEVKDGEVTLTGSIPERSMKHLAEECAERTSGVRDVINQLRVKRESTSDTSSESASRSSSVGSSSTSMGTSGSTSSKRGSSSTSLS